MCIDTVWLTLKCSKILLLLLFWIEKTEKTKNWNKHHTTIICCAQFVRNCEMYTGIFNHKTNQVDLCLPDYHLRHWLTSSRVTLVRSSPQWMNYNRFQETAEWISKEKSISGYRRLCINVKTSCCLYFLYLSGSFFLTLFFFPSIIKFSHFLPELPLLKVTVIVYFKDCNWYRHNLIQTPLIHLTFKTT